MEKKNLLRKYLGFGKMQFSSLLNVQIEETENLLVVQLQSEERLRNFDIVPKVQIQNTAQKLKIMVL